MIDWDSSAGHLVESRCPKCGKTFFPAPYHVYTDSRKRRYCCWTCFNHRNDGKIKNPRWKAVEALYPDGTLYMEFQSVTKATEWVGGKYPAGIKQAIKDGTTYQGYLWRYKNEPEQENNKTDIDPC